MRSIRVLILIVISILLCSSCSLTYDHVRGSSVDYYLHNNSSIALYYELEGAPSSRESSGVVEIGQIKKIAWTTQYEVNGPSFQMINVYDNVSRSKLLFQTDYNSNTSNYWNLEKIDAQLLIYRQTLIVVDDMLSFGE